MTEEISKAYDNVFEALDLPYEAAALDILSLVDPCPSGEVIQGAADIIRQAVAKEQKRLRTILGFGVVTKKEVDGHEYNVCHDPYYDLEGAVYDLERQNADKACIKTIKRHQAKLIAFEKATKPLDSD